MKELTLVLLIVPFVFTHHNLSFKSDEDCVNSKNIFPDYRKAYYDYFFNMHRLVSERYHKNFVFSARSIGLTLAAMAEGADSVTKQKLFNFLKFPENQCQRQEYYKMATKSLVSSQDVETNSASVLVADESLKIRSDWKDWVSKHSLLNVTDLPLKSKSDQAIAKMEEIMSVPLEGLNLTGNSVLLDKTEFNWTAPASDAELQKSPFYDQKGEMVGYVDLIKMKKQVRMKRFPDSIGTLVELPIGNGNRYRIFVAKFKKYFDLADIVHQMNANDFFAVVGSLQNTDEPVEVAIPRVVLTSWIDVRALLENAGISGLWNDGTATSSISEPPALPSSFLHCATLSLDTVRPVDTSNKDVYTYESAQDEHKFIANTPILYSIFDVETYTTVVSVSFTEPTYPI